MSILSGCSSNAGGSGQPTQNPDSGLTTIPSGDTTGSYIASTLTRRPTFPPTSNCPGKRLGQYTWGTELWRQGSTILSDFFATEAGKEWGCGDVTINIGDYTEVTKIAFVDDVVPFIEAYRASSKNWESVVWLSYGDVVSGDGSLMVQFVDTFYAWASSLSEATAESLGTVGLSFDVEHMPPASTETALQRAQSLKSTTKFAKGKLLVQHTIEGNPNPDGTDYVMKYADAALIMLYRNYMKSSSFNTDSNILSRTNYFMVDQCVHCLDDAYAAANYKAKITIMVEAACSPADYCGKISFCAHDAPGEGATYLWDTLQEMEQGIFSSGLMTTAQFDRLFNPLTTYGVHDWSWFRCYAPLSDSVSYAQCKTYHQAAQTCRDTLGPISTTTLAP